MTDHIREHTSMPMPDAQKIAILKALMVNLGRLIPEGMTLTFRRDPGCMATLEQIFPDGELASFVFADISPIYSVPVVPSEYGIGSS